jgi:hypothetical protein
MKTLCQKILGGSLLAALAVLNLPAQNVASLGNLPLWFETGAPGNFIAHASGAEFAITPGGAEFALTKAGGQSSDCRMQFLGANTAARITGETRLGGTVNYLLGGESGQWRTGVPTFAQVRVENVYPGVNVVYYGSQQKLEYDFNLAAGVSPSVIALRFNGAKKISTNPQGELVVTLRDGEVVQHAPVAYQIVEGARHEVAAGYQIVDAHTAAFTLGSYDHATPLVIDPVLSYSSYFGGNNKDTAWAIAVNPTDGSIYVAGQTFSSTFKTGHPLSTTGVVRKKYQGGSLSGDAFVARFDVDGTGTNLILHYATYLGGSGNDAALGLAVDTNGDAFVTGFTDSANFPTTKGLFSKIKGPMNSHTKTYAVDAFVTELNTNGTGLVYSTYLGGSSMDAAYGIALDDAGNAYVAGYTYSTNFPTTAKAIQKHLRCTPSLYYNANAFVAEISAGGTNLNYSTYLGGTNFDVARGIACKTNRVFVVGRTSSYNFPNTNAITGFTNLNNSGKSPIFGHGNSAFVTAFGNANVTNLNLLYSTFLGGSNYDSATGVAADGNGSAYVCGYTSSRDFPNTNNIAGLSNGFYTNKTYSLFYTNLPVTNAFLTRIDYTNGTNAVIGYSAVFGGKNIDIANGVAVDSANNAYVIGTARSLDFPTNNTGGFLGSKVKTWPNTNSADVFVIAFTNNCSAVLYSGCLGGKGDDFGNAIATYSYSTTNSTATNNVSSVYLAGQTSSGNFPLTTNALQRFRNSTNDMFIAIIISTVSPKTDAVIKTVPALVIVPENISFSSVQNKVAGSQSAAQPGISLKWQASLTDSNYAVEGSTDLTPGSWHTVPASFTYSDGCYHVTLPTTNGMQFFRLVTTNVVPHSP